MLVLVHLHRKNDKSKSSGITVNEYKGLKDGCDKVISCLAMQKAAGGLDAFASSAKHTENFSKILSTLFDMEKKFLQDHQKAGAGGPHQQNMSSSSSFGASRHKTRLDYD